MVKDPASVYQPGRRGLGWLKLKRPLATLDCVVVGVEWGHGKRRGVLSDYTFAVRETDGDRLLTIGKAYTGLTDAEIAEMTERFKSLTVRDFGRYRTVVPEVVVEIAFARRGTSRGSPCAFPGSCASAPTKVRMTSTTWPLSSASSSSRHPGASCSPPEPAARRSGSRRPERRKGAEGGAGSMAQ